MTDTHTNKFTVAHVTHEAVEKVGGIGTVLEGMMCSKAYQAKVERSILVGPMGMHHHASPLTRFGENGSVYYSTPDEIDPQGLGRFFHPIERAYGVQIAYGTRRFVDEGTGRPGEAEILLFDVANPAKEPLDNFKSRLWKEFGIESMRFETDWGFEEYCRLAEPAFYAISALLEPEQFPCIVMSHEFMGMCTALKAVMDGGDHFRTVFHAHECATARNVVEHHSGHDTAFYNLLKRAESTDTFVEDVFGDQSGVMRHALISRAHHLDAIAAVGDPTAREMRFLNRETKYGNVQLVYNGIPAIPTTAETKERSRTQLLDWAESTVGYRPDFIMTHVTRPVISKGIWRDLKVLNALTPMLEAEGLSAVYMLLTCGAPPRGPQQVLEMGRDFDWPRHHAEGYPDLVGPEIGINDMFEPFNENAPHVQAVLVNQFGWSRELVGPSVPEGMNFTDLRRAADVEFGQSTYEPFGIAQLEPIGAGAICIPSSVCGCVFSWRHVLKHMGLECETDCPNVLVADYTELGDQSFTQAELLEMSESQRTVIEERVASSIATELMQRLPRTAKDRARLVEMGQRLEQLMSWDAVIADELLPLFESIVNSESSDGVRDLQGTPSRCKN